MLMKNLRLFSTNFLTKILALSLFVLLVNCSELDQEEAILIPGVSGEVSLDWINILDQLELESTIIVQKSELIQDAVDAALPGDVIYVEPGVYDEVLKINKSDLRLVGLDNSMGERVILNNPVSGNDVEFFNVDGMVQSHDIANLSNARKAKRRCLLKMDRVDLGKGVAHYTFDLKLGDGEFDVVKVHRVVKEKRPYSPIRTKGDIFMVHGAIQDFDDIFLTAGAEVINEKTSSPFYLALNRIDVWGIDLGWTRVPMEPLDRDFSFMKDWGVEKDVTHTLKTMSIARLIRGLSGQSFCRMNLLGFSYGLNVAYGAAGRETQQHWILRDVKGIIPVDSRLTTDIESIQQIKCNEAAYWLGVMDGGQYHHPWGVDLINWGELTIASPNTNDLHPQMTNSQFLEFVGTQGFFGGENGVMKYTDPLRFFTLSANLSPHMPAQMFYDMPAGGCPDRNESYVMYLSEIAVPILYIGAGGGAAETGFYTCTQTSSVDATQMVVSVNGDPATDYGHADLWMARDADVQVWTKLHGWLIDHK